MSNCLEISRNGRLCAGAEEYEKKVARLETIALGILEARGCGCCEDHDQIDKYQEELAGIVGAERDKWGIWDFTDACERHGIET